MWCVAYFSVFLLAGSTVLAENGLDLDLLKKNSQIFQRIVGEVVKQNFPHAFALPLDPESVYLRGYGVVTVFHLNINRGVIQTPFGPTRARGPKRTKEEQIETLQEAMIRCLADYGNTFKQLSGNDRISITAQVEDRSQLGSAQDVTTLVVSVEKQDVDTYTSKQISFDDFRRKVQMVRY